ncbi:type I DNA topoisomerase [Luteibaculum oceani]|uniref:DNA topoisomerase 1 n=1 Tax=Luteibaculum oceani TaxID=1294296 RepID=A0A5C6V5F6_9FLAO|nr:type I DNA topoisomerase [Luteibaculum oceani]TXC78855.1 type I DNA topoisomerase [Luteibaculum oceani]
MAKNLLIVESPAKAGTIEKYLGKDFVVKSSYGHIRDLEKKETGVKIEDGFEPVYVIDPDKKKLVTELKKLAKDAEMVWLATDEDREGEAISWHLAEALKLNPDKTKRITFNEITKPAVLRSLENPRTINNNLVDAQQARRVLDRLVGFELSPVLWKKVKPALSAGRVQSVAVRLIVEREREILDFKPETYFKVNGKFKNTKGELFKAEISDKLNSEAEVKEILEAVKGDHFSVKDLQVKPGKKTPAPPFTTSTLQQEASRKLSFSVSQTMGVAQKLYEAGYITYMRTDSVNLSETALNGARDAITSEFGNKYHKQRQYTSKSKGAQEAHEAIRPTDFTRAEISGDNQAQRLYELIWKRAIASQMSDAEIERTTVLLENNAINYDFRAKGEVIKFDGFLKVYIESTDDEPAEEAGILPSMTIGESIAYDVITGTQRFTHHPPRYSEARLVKKLEEQGIGRPSTYAPTISTVQKRGYVVKEERPGKERSYIQLELAGKEVARSQKTEITGAEKGKLFPTDIGMVVNDFLVENFEGILDYGFTAEVEDQFDRIASGEIQWKKMIEKFYGPFHETVENTLEHSERATGERHLGEDPKTGKEVIARIGRYGPMVQLGKTDEEEDKPQFASLRSDQSIATITLEDALELFKLPRVLGELEGKKVQANIGRFGPYVQWGSTFASLKASGLDPMEVDYDQAVELIQEKVKADKEKTINIFDGKPVIKVLKGRYGPYIAVGRKNFKIPKGFEPEELDRAQCEQIINEAPAKKTKTKKKK